MDLNRFVVDQLVPENRQGGKTFALSDESVSPIRIVRDPSGILREETICTLAKHAKFVDPAGNICDVALRTGRVLSDEPAAAHYEQVVVADQIRAGSLVLDACPFTLQFQHLRRGWLVANPESIPDCGGAPGGCEHMKVEIAARRKVSRAKWEAEQLELKKMTEADAKAMMQGVVEAFGELLEAKAMQAGGRKGLRGKGEEG